MKLRIAIVLAALAAFTGQPTHAAADAAQDLAALLARPISPGAVAMLADHAGDPAVQKRLAEAVKHEDAAVRAVAARVAFTTQSKRLAPALISAVAKEEHAQTAAEQVRALMGLLGAPGDQIVLRAVSRIGGPTAIAMAEPRALATACAQYPSFATDILQATLAAKSPYLFDTAINATPVDSFVHMSMQFQAP